MSVLGLNSRCTVKYTVYLSSRPNTDTISHHIILARYTRVRWGTQATTSYILSYHIKSYNITSYHISKTYQCRVGTQAMTLYNIIILIIRQGSISRSWDCHSLIISFTHWQTDWKLKVIPSCWTSSLVFYGTEEYFLVLSGTNWYFVLPSGEAGYFFFFFINLVTLHFLFLWLQKLCFRYFFCT